MAIATSLVENGYEAGFWRARLGTQKVYTRIPWRHALPTPVRPGTNPTNTPFSINHWRIKELRPPARYASIPSIHVTIKSCITPKFSISQIGIQPGPPPSFLLLSYPTQPCYLSFCFKAGSLQTMSSNIFIEDSLKRSLLPSKASSIHTISLSKSRIRY